MSNVVCMTEGLMNKLQKHLDLADIWFESGDMLAYDDHMKIAESIMAQLDDFDNHKVV